MLGNFALVIGSGLMLAERWAVKFNYEIQCVCETLVTKCTSMGYVYHTHISILTFDVGDEDGTLVGEVVGLDVGCER